MELIADEYLSGGESTGLRDLSAIPTSLKTLMRLISHWTRLSGKRMVDLQPWVHAI